MYVLKVTSGQLVWYNRDNSFKLTLTFKVYSILYKMYNYYNNINKYLLILQTSVISQIFFFFGIFNSQ